jgi:hypothetical protein
MHWVHLKVKQIYPSYVLITNNLVVKKLMDLLHYLMSRSENKCDRNRTLYGIVVGYLGSGSRGGFLRGRVAGEEV